MAGTVISVLLSLSLSGSLVILLLFSICRLLKKRLSYRWQYYIWIVVVIRFILPIAPEENLMGRLGEWLHSSVQAQLFGSDGWELLGNSYVQEESTVKGQGQNAEKDFGKDGGNVNKGQGAAIKSRMIKTILGAGQYIFFFWLFTAMLLFLRKITIYQSFVRFIKAGSTPVEDVTRLEGLAETEDSIGIYKAIDLWINPLVSSPMILGFLRPCIILPDDSLSEKEFHYTILHELIHYKRKDIYYKWVMQAVLCIHWFNPLLYFMARNLNRLCELSCDEAVVKCLGSDKQRREYASTLLNAMASKGVLKERFTALTLSENKQLLKERMEAVMNGKRRIASTGGKVALAVLTVAVVVAGLFAGSYTVSASDYKEFIEKPQLDSLKTGKGNSKSDRITAAQADKMALALTNKIWVWEWVEFFVPYMTDKGVEKLLPASRNSEWAGAVDMVTGKKIKFTKKKINAARKKKPSSALVCGDIDSHAFMIMQSNGDWECISFMLPYMSRKGIRAVVSCYNSKHGGEEKRAKDYY